MQPDVKRVAFATVPPLSIGITTISIIGLLRAGTIGDVLLLALMNGMSFGIVALVTAMSSHRKRQSMICPGSIVAVTVGTFLLYAWFPGYDHLAGSPIIGFIWVAFTAMCIAVLGSVLAAAFIKAKPNAIACGVCGYPQKGLATNRCPECGAEGTTFTESPSDVSANNLIDLGKRVTPPSGIDDEAPRPSAPK